MVVELEVKVEMNSWSMVSFLMEKKNQNQF